MMMGKAWYFAWNYHFFATFEAEIMRFYAKLYQEGKPEKARKIKESRNIEE